MRVEMKAVCINDKWVCNSKSNNPKPCIGDQVTVIGMMSVNASDVYYSLEEFPGYRFLSVHFVRLNRSFSVFK